MSQFELRCRRDGNNDCSPTTRISCESASGHSTKFSESGRTEPSFSHILLWKPPVVTVVLCLVEQTNPSRCVFPGFQIGDVASQRS